MPARQTAESFTQAAREKHGTKYDYSRVQYVNNKTAVAIVCPDHGEFQQVPADHVHAGAGCPVCVGSVRLTMAQFLADAKAAHGDRYDYSLVVLDSNTAPVTIICPEHGAFQQTPKQHRKGRGCPTCGGTTKLTQESMLDRFRDAHGDTYDYSRAEYVGARKPVTIGCPTHGWVQQVASLHWEGRGCPKCGHSSGSAKLRTPVTTLQAALEAARPNTHINLTAYVNRGSFAELCCPNGHTYQQRVADVPRYGCAQCVGQNSAGEQELRAFIESLGVRVEKTRSVIPPKELDAWCPDHNVGFEFNGLYFHSDAVRPDARTMHRDKSAAVAAAGGRLVHIWSDDWEERRSAVEGLIRARLGLLPVTGARECVVRAVPRDEARTFLSVHHLQGWVSADYLGLYSREGVLVACMGIAVARSVRGATNPRAWELVRYAASGRISGGGSRLLAAWKSAHMGEWDTLTTYCDLAQFDGRLYEGMGFTLRAERGPDYKVLLRGGKRRMHKSTTTKAKLAVLMGESYDESKTESQLCAEVGISRVWDCGMRSYVLSQ